MAINTIEWYCLLLWKSEPAFGGHSIRQCLPSTLPIQLGTLHFSKKNSCNFLPLLMIRYRHVKRLQNLPNSIAGALDNSLHCSLPNTKLERKGSKGLTSSDISEKQIDTPCYGFNNDTTYHNVIEDAIANKVTLKNRMIFFWEICFSNYYYISFFPFSFLLFSSQMPTVRRNGSSYGVISCVKKRNLMLFHPVLPV